MIIIYSYRDRDMGLGRIRDMGPGRDPDMGLERDRERDRDRDQDIGPVSLFLSFFASLSLDLARRRRHLFRTCPGAIRFGAHPEQMPKRNSSGGLACLQLEPIPGESHALANSVHYFFRARGALPPGPPEWVPGYLGAVGPWDLIYAFFDMFLIFCHFLKGYDRIG